MFVADKEKCVHCGLCIKDCSVGALEFDENKFPKIDEDKCFKCQHCLAICPTGAISVCGKNPENSEDIQEHDSENVLNLIKSRRSIRHYKKENLDPDKLEKLKSMLNWVPTGCNVHKLHFSFIDDINVMNDFRNCVNEKIVNSLSDNQPNPIADKFGRHAKLIAEGKDVIFRGAPHLVVAATPTDVPCYDINPIIALSYFELYAQSMNVGTCWCGLAQYCLDLMPELSKYLQIPDNYKPFYVMLFGEPDVKYARTVQQENFDVISVEKGKGR